MDKIDYLKSLNILEPQIIDYCAASLTSLDIKIIYDLKELDTWILRKKLGLLDNGIVPSFDDIYKELNHKLSLGRVKKSYKNSLWKISWHYYHYLDNIKSIGRIGMISDASKASVFELKLYIEKARLLNNLNIKTVGELVKINDTDWNCYPVINTKDKKMINKALDKFSIEQMILHSTKKQLIDLLKAIRDDKVKTLSKNKSQ